MKAACLCMALLTPLVPLSKSAKKQSKSAKQECQVNYNNNNNLNARVPRVPRKIQTTEKPILRVPRVPNLWQECQEMMKSQQQAGEGKAGQYFGERRPETLDTKSSIFPYKDTKLTGFVTRSLSGAMKAQIHR